MEIDSCGDEGKVSSFLAYILIQSIFERYLDGKKRLQ